MRRRCSVTNVSVAGTAHEVVDMPSELSLALLHKLARHLSVRKLASDIESKPVSPLDMTVLELLRSEGTMARNIASTGADDAGAAVGAGAGAGAGAPPKGPGYSCGSTSTQTANALGLRVNPSRADAVDALVRAVAAKGYHFDTGIVGTKHVLETLAQHGRADVALRILLRPDYPGFGFWVSQGATSLW